MINKDIISTHIANHSGESFTYKDKCRWPKLRNIMYDMKGLFGTNHYFYREDLLKSGRISETYKKRLAKLKPGGSCQGNSNGGGRWEYFRVLLQEDIDLLLEEEKLIKDLQDTQEELKKIAPDLVNKIKDLNNKIAKHRKKLDKENLR